MGQYTRKDKFSEEIADVEITVTPLGVRTRAHALALQRLQKQHAHGEKEDGSREYLELRSRRVEKLTPPMVAKKRYGRMKAAVATTTTQEEDEASFRGQYARVGGHG
ncbi:hypothetical protein HU200_049449 [Digitaria exilis]|uniref:Uncharacterized protein n=1 Tax=Digitaria exilis TaxID=1010633 RepID=A0A835AZE4_9POAL|nr:hypothetical protein HU200_049449 [Digitaria exilis]CAB3499409.1 unnamed protein product [Digitaria exilis]